MSGLPNGTDVLQHINFADARNTLAAYQVDLDLDSNLNQLADFNDNLQKGLFHAEVVRCGEPSLPRLCFVADEEIEEAVFTVQGFITQCYLPPITGRRQLPKKALYATQSVYISGFGDSTFARAIKSLDSIYDVFAAKFSAPTVKRFDSRTWRGQPLLLSGNRFFTRQAHVPHEVLNSFKPEIDPKQVLLKFAQSSEDSLVHIGENKVKYYCKDAVIEDNVERFRFKKCPPAAFHLGDLVQLDVSFVAFYNIKEKSHTIQPVLRGVYLLDSSDRMRALTLIKNPTPTTSKRILKRKLTADDSSSDELSEDHIELD